MFKKFADWIKGLRGPDLPEHVGTFAGNCLLQPMQFDVEGNKQIYQYIPDVMEPLTYTTSFGQKIRPEAMITDMGSIPSWLWSLPGLARDQFLLAYLIHDWLFEAKELGRPETSFEDANYILAEAIRTTMQSRGQVDEGLIRKIFVACNSPIGRKAWEDMS